MRIPVAWLRSYCDPALPAEDIADRLTMAGLKLERLHRTGVGDIAGFLTGRVLRVDRHPSADRLTVCSVDIGGPEPQTIVCGAPNVAPGQTVAVALPGALMPDGTVLGEATLRGVSSSGMILAEDEVGIGEDHAGIMVLADGARPGAPLSEHLPIADEVIEIEITPNRPDAMGVYGVAREVHAATGAPLALFGRNLPVAALIPLTILWFGIDESQKVMFIFIACVPFVYSDSVRAIASVPDRYVETAQTLGASPGAPRALPQARSSLSS